MASPASIIIDSTRACIRLLYPPHCNWCGVSCGDEEHVLLCGECQRLFVPEKMPPRCSRCASLLPNHSLQAADCAHCRRHRQKFSAAFALASYSGVPRAAVLRMKKSREEALAWSLGRLLAQSLHAQIAAAKPDIVVAIPMHWTRRLWRGINGPDILANCLARRLKLPLGRHVLRRRRMTEPLEDLSQDARAKTLRQVFSARRTRRIQGRRVLLVDDVITTGSTCNSASTALKAAGAADVICAVLARTE